MVDMAQVYYAVPSRVHPEIGRRQAGTRLALVLAFFGLFVSTIFG